MRGFFYKADLVNGRRVSMGELHTADLTLFYTTEVNKGKGRKRSPHSEVANLKCSPRGQAMGKGQPGPPG